MKQKIAATDDDRVLEPLAVEELDGAADAVDRRLVAAVHVRVRVPAGRERRQLEREPGRPPPIAPEMPKMTGTSCFVTCSGAGARA